MIDRPLPYNGRTWKLAALVAMGLFVVLSVIVLMERWLHPERAQNGEHAGHPERLHRRSLPPEVKLQFDDLWKKK